MSSEKTNLAAGGPPHAQRPHYYYAIPQDEAHEVVFLRRSQSKVSVTILIGALVVVACVGLAIALAFYWTAGTDPGFHRDSRSRSGDDGIGGERYQSSGGNLLLQSSADGSSSNKKSEEKKKEKCPGTEDAAERALHPMGVYSQGAVAADHENCSIIGRDVLAEGGSAVDAAIATQLCIGVLHPHSAGIGGGSFMVYYKRSEQKAYTLDAREVAAAAATKNMYANNSKASTKGGLAIAVPGEVAGMWAAHQKFGVLPWARLFKPAIRLAEDGFPINKALSIDVLKNMRYILFNPEFRSIFYNETTGKVNVFGDTVKMLKLAETLKKLSADGGVDSYYKGELGDNITAEIQNAGGIITKEDLMNYAPREEEPINGTVDGSTIYGLRPPSSGALFQFIMNVIEGYNLTASDKSNPITYNRIVEAYKFAFSVRSNMGDSKFVAGIDEIVKNLTSDKYADEIRSFIVDNKTHSSEYYGGVFTTPDSGTSHISILAPNGDAVAVTTTINTKFGSKVIGNMTGIIYNNEMDDFSTQTENYFDVPPSPANFIEPGKKPMSSMSPIIMVNATGDVVMVTGASGGTRIPTSTTYSAIRFLWLNDTLKESNDAARLHHQLYPRELKYECNFNQTLIKSLESYGHNTTSESRKAYSVVQTIARMDNDIYAYSDFRKGGLPAGI